MRLFIRKCFGSGFTTLITSNEEMNDIMKIVKSHDESSLLIKGISETITNKANAAWKVSKYGVISGQHFPLFGLTTGKYGPERTLYFDTFHAVKITKRRISQNVIR